MAKRSSFLFGATSALVLFGAGPAFANGSPVKVDICHFEDHQQPFDGGEFSRPCGDGDFLISEGGECGASLCEFLGGKVLRVSVHALRGHLK